uniref:RRM domain-containing protein n=1 Tax=Rhizophagus irregularis (strain DAOM 181602 / DAOM 197198 / MUCL 43194) TaxID=747089 RepID=U9USZ4_RHIID
MAYFKKFENITSCRLFSRPNAKVQQARIVYDNADSIARFTDQWAVYCFSTCLRITPCFYTVDQKAARRQYVATLTQLPPNVKDINLAPLTRDLGAKAVNVPLSLNSYKPKRWAYVTFNSQETMDAAMEQTVSFQGKVLFWSSPDNTNVFVIQWQNSKNDSMLINLAPILILPMHTNSNNINNRNTPNPNSTQHTWQHSKERSVSFSSSFRSTARPLPRQTPNSALSSDDANNILNLLRELQCEVANFHKRISALELADQRMTRIESHLGLDPLPTLIKPELDLMQEDAPISHVPLNIQPSAKSSSPLKVF